MPRPRCFWYFLGVDDDDSQAPGKAPSHRTIQIDALTDVEIVDHGTDEGGEEGGEDEAAAPQVGRAPPPLPPKEGASPSMGKIVGLAFIALVVGALGVLAAHFAFPPAAPTAPPAVAAAPPEASAPASVRQVHMAEELVIRADEEPGADDAPE